MEKQTSLDTWLKVLESRHVNEIQLGLTRIQQVASSLNLLKFPGLVISVGGTNGKGSTVAILESIYVAAGYSVGSYTSPHLIQFNERIKINTKPISDEALVSAFEMIEKKRGSVALTYFETVTLAALWYFKQSSLDIIILEVGLGGRLDATNVIDNDLAIITTVDKDHESYLGNTLEKIGFEKAGIMRPNTPCIYADTLTPKSIENYALHIGSNLILKGKDYEYEVKGNTLKLTYLNQSISILRPHFHTNSVAAAIVSVFILRSILPVNDNIIQYGLDNTKLNGRLQWINGLPRTLVDVAHNPQAARYLASYLKLNKPKGRIYAVFSALADKNIFEIINSLKNCVDTWFLALLSEKRAATKEQLLMAMEKNEVSGTLCYNNPVYAYEAACNIAKTDDLIIVFGSFLTAASILSWVRRDDGFNDE